MPEKKRGFRALEERIHQIEEEHEKEERKGSRETREEKGKKEGEPPRKA